MSRPILFLTAVPIIVLIAMGASGQLSLADFNMETEPVEWPSNTPKNQGTTPTQANLSITKFASADPSPVGVPLTYTVIITNSGPSNAEQVILADTLPTNISYHGAVTPTQGSCYGTLTIICALNTITSGHTVTATILVTPTGGLSMTNIAYVISLSTFDPDESDNTARVSTEVGPGQASPADYIIYLPLIFKNF